MEKIREKAYSEELGADWEKTITFF
jgi:hypothetical protein